MTFMKDMMIWVIRLMVICNDGKSKQYLRTTLFDSSVEFAIVCKHNSRGGSHWV